MTTKTRRRNPAVRNEAGYELYLFVVNDGDLYRMQGESILKNLFKKQAAGKYDSKLAVKLWRYYADNAAKKYTFEYDNAGTARNWQSVKGFGAFSVADRNETARLLEEYYRDNIPDFSPRRSNPVKTIKAKKFADIVVEVSVDGGKSWEIYFGVTAGPRNSYTTIERMAKAEARAISKTHPSYMVRVKAL